MALPSLEKTWQFNVNQEFRALNSVADCYRQLVLAIKDTLKSFGTSPWTVRGSSDGTTATDMSSPDNTDRWSTISDLVHADDNQPHSWIVLEQPGLGSNAQLLIQFAVDNTQFQSGTKQRFMWVIFSPTGTFTGGTTSSRPTATDEIILMNGDDNSSFFDGTILEKINDQFSFVLHGMQSTDGESTRIIVCHRGASKAFWLLDQMQDAVTGIATPACAVISSTSEGNGRGWEYSELNDNDRIRAYDPTPGVFNMYATCEGFANAMVGEQDNIRDQSNVFDGTWPMFPIGLASTDVDATGRHGRLADIWWTVTTLPTGMTFPNDGSHQFAVFNHVVLPWNGSAPKTVP